MLITYFITKTRLADFHTQHLRPVDYPAPPLKKQQVPTQPPIEPQIALHLPSICPYLPPLETRSPQQIPELPRVPVPPVITIRQVLHDVGSIISFVCVFQPLLVFVEKLLSSYC
jgi:hypothetical protein